MDYFQGVVTEYLRASRQTFVNPEFQLQLDGPSHAPPKGAHWYVDLLAVNLEERAVYLCEVSYSQSLGQLVKRLTAWDSNWGKIGKALQRDAATGCDWPVRPWIFVHERALDKLIPRLLPLQVPPKITTLEMTLPWCYCSYDRKGEAVKPDVIPEPMR